MSDHDASPKEWTPAHSEKHGPQRWLSKQQRKQLLAQQAYIAAITAGAANNVAVPQPHFSYPLFAPNSAAAAAASSSSSAARRRRSSGGASDSAVAAAAVDGSTSASSSQHSTPGPEDSDAASAVSVPPDIEEEIEEEITSESDEDEHAITFAHAFARHSQQRPMIQHGSSLPTHSGDGSAGHLRRLSSAPLPQSFSEMDGSWIPPSQAPPPLLQQPTQPWCACAACQTAAAHQVAAQQQYLQSLARTHSQRASPSSSHQTPSQSTPFTVTLSPPMRARQSLARRSMQLVPVTGAADGSSFDDASSAVSGLAPAASSILSAARSASAFTTPVPTLPPILPRQLTTVEAQRASAKLVAAGNMPLSTAAVAAAAAIAAAASPASAVASSPSPTPTPAPLASISMLPRWFLILLAVLKETDGRDKIAKCVQYGGRSLAILLRKLPAAMWWIAFASKHLRQGRVGTIGRAIHVFLAGENPVSSVVTAAGEAVSTVALAAQSTFATALRSSYAADTSALRSKLESSPLYTGALSRIAVLTAALSSGRRMIRVVKWTYTLPNWCKAYQAWRTQVRASMEAQAVMAANRAAEEEEARLHESKQQQQKQLESALADDDSTQHARSLSDAAALSAHSAPKPSSPRFRFSHPHPPHLISRLPWLSSVELMDLSIAVLTDMTDDLEWLSKYSLFPARWGYVSGRLAMAFWFTTVLLDLSLTFRILKHYNYQQREIQTQIDEAQMEYATCAHEMEKRMEARAMREMRREQLRSIQKSPLFKRHSSRSGADEQQRAMEKLEPLGPPALDSAVLVTPQPATQSQQQLMASAGSDASWSVLSDASRGGVQQGSSSVSSHDSASMASGDSIGSGGSNSSSKSSSRSASGSEHADDPAPAPVASSSSSASPPPRSDSKLPQLPRHDSALEPDAEVAQASGAPEEQDENEDEDDSTSDLLQSASVVAYRRVSSLRSQLSAIQQSLFLQYINFAKFTFDLGCATPMAWGVQADHDTLVQTTGLVSGLLGVYKLFLTTKPAS